MQKQALLIDDKFSDLIEMKTMLESEGFRVSTAANSTQIARALEKNLFDIIFVDVHLQTLSWHDVLELSTIRSKCKTPIICVSEYQKKAEYLSLADGFIQKPFSHKTFIHEVNKILKPNDNVEDLPKAKKILIVDEEHNTHRAVRRSLGNERYIIVTADTCDECLEKTTTFKPDLVLIDLSIRGKPTREVIKQITDSKIAYVSAARISESEMLELFNQKNVVAFIQKPFDTEEFVKKVIELVE